MSFTFLHWILPTLLWIIFFLFFVFCREERQRYYTNRQLAIEDCKEYLSVIIDGMDQNKTNVPHLVRVPKSCQNLWSLMTHLTGCLVHGSGNYGYFDFLQWSHDCNLTLTTLLLTLVELSQKGPLPHKMLLQMDNCVRENKNKFVMAFMALLVEKQIFIEVSHDYQSPLLESNSVPMCLIDSDGIFNGGSYSQRYWSGFYLPLPTLAEDWCNNRVRYILYVHIVGYVKAYITWEGYIHVHSCVPVLCLHTSAVIYFCVRVAHTACKVSFVGCHLPLLGSY